ncbi:hypothetical protein CDL15_Pgr006868 [Punica granatum]|uniref:Transketolase N-terminal domain-containing protein n=1 Tax=Punica granatum TaxID=22663 RepID=A0A218X7A1_PUNGR|nr:hypothetical protein CDL15_Pgr006868 [Punica granatum]
MNHLKEKNWARYSQEKLLSLVAERLIDSNSNVTDAGYVENQGRYSTVLSSMPASHTGSNSSSGRLQHLMKVMLLHQVLMTAKPYMKEKKAYWILNRHALKIERSLCMKSTNHISIDGDIKNAFTESVNTCFEGLGWHVIWVKNGNTSYDEIRAAIKQAKVVKDKPTLIKITTTIAFGSSNKVNTYSVYGSALGAKEVDATRKNLGWPYEPFLIPEDVKSHWSRHIPNGAALETEWNAKFSEYEKKFRVNKKGKKESPVAATLCVKHSP